MANKHKSLLFALSAVLFWSTVATAFKLTLAGMSNAQLLFYSSLTSLIVLFFFVLAYSPNELKQFFKKHHLKNNLVLGFINPFIYYLILFKAYSILPAQEAQPVNLTWPLIISIFSALFLKQKLTVKVMTGMLVSFIGVVVIATRGNIFSLHFHNLYGVILALSSSFIWASFWILNLLDSREESTKLFGAFFFGTIYTGIYIFFFDSFGPVETKYMLGAIYVGLFEMGITFFLWLKALSLSDNKAKTSTVVYLFPVISLFFIALVLEEKLFVSSIIGLVMIVGGILVQQIGNKEVL
ncbi:MAG: EamA family transporter [Ignavibacteriales bacterium]|nr:EamA family transporter [Ignavibacteriales bacterium]